MNIHQMSVTELEEHFQVSVESGMTNEEVKRRQSLYGLNEITETKKKSMLKIFLMQFNDIMIWILLAALTVSIVLDNTIDAYAIIAIIIINAFLGFFQENRAEKSLTSLKNFSTPQMTVLRDKLWIKTPANEAVIGDIVSFSGGDRISADMRIIKQTSLEIEESSLTGESLPVHKSADVHVGKIPTLAEQTNMAFMGTLVTKGSGVGIITATGMKTEIGAIAKMINTTAEVKTPLQTRMEHLGKILVVIVILLTAIVVIAGIFHGNSLYTMILAGVSLAVAAIPEGLPAIITVALSIGVQKMVKKRALIRKLPVVETLGCTSVICSDKTGTMTENKMTVTTVWTGDSTWNVSGIGYQPKGEFTGINLQPNHEQTLHKILTYGALCNNANILIKNDNYILDGDPTDGALLVSAMKSGLTKEFLQEKFTIIKEFPFDSARKCMSVIVKDKENNQFIITKGAPDILINHCTSILWDEKEVKLDTNHEQKITRQLHHMTGQALRTIAIAYKIIPPDQQIESEVKAEKNLTFIGLQGIIDPPRPEVRDAVRKCSKAGIKTVMITGDHRDTAVTIAKQLDVYKEGDKVITGSEMEELSTERLEKIVNKVSVFARVTPEHKLRIVQAFQVNGHTVAMTGDGVNDAPAIKSADVGISMGITGTDVAKETADVVLLDDSFTTIKTAIQEGRNIYENIRKFIRFLLASNVGEILVMLLAMLLSLPLPLIPIHILSLNLITDGLPAMALGLDRPEKNVMQMSPRKANESIFARHLGWKVISRGILIGISSLSAFIIVYYRQPDELQYAQTVTFATLVLSQLIHVFDCRSEVSIFSRNPFGNKYLIYSVLCSLILMLVVIYYEPLQGIFHTVKIIPQDWILIIIMSCIPTFLLAIGYLLGNKRKKK